jgi:Asp-tRNA(Asn)/Glu-tRNA(Gln) amidotransferase A subunit family amidase
LTHQGKLSPDTREYLDFGAGFSAEDYVRAGYRRDEIYRTYVDLFAHSGAHALLTPTLGCEAFPHGTRYPPSIAGQPIEPPWLDWAGFLYDANLAGLPACAVPAGLGDDGLPVSVQLLGPRWSDGTVLALAELVESLLGIPKPLPTAQEAT